MAKMIKKKKLKRRVSLPGVAVVLFLFSTIAYISSSLFLRSHNNTLSSEKQRIESEIAAIQTQNDALRVVIQSLSARDRVDYIATENGLKLDQDNIVTITAISEDGE